MTERLRRIIGARGNPNGKRFLIVFAVVLVILASSVFRFKNNLDANLKKNASERLMDVAESQRSLIQAHLSSMTGELNYHATTLAQLLGGSPERLQKALQSAVDAGTFQWLTICDQNGRGWSVDGSQSDLRDSDAFAAAQQGKSWVDARQGTVTLATPILNAGRPAGMLVGGYSTDRLTEFSQDYIRNSSSCIMLTHGNGDVLSVLESWQHLMTGWQTAEQFFDSGTILAGGSYDAVQEDMSLELGDTLVLELEKEELLITYVPLHISDWYIFCMVPYRLVEKDVESISRDAYDISIKLALALTLLLVYLLHENRKQVEALTEQQREMRAATARYKLISARSKDVILEYDVRKGFVVHCENAAVLSDPDLRGANFMQNLVERGLVHPEDAGLLHERTTAVAEGGVSAELELRLKLNTNDYRWYQLDMVCVCDDEGLPWRVVVRASDIDRQKRERQALQQRAVRDPLTKLYNKTATRTEIDRALEECPNRCHALMIVDVDNFKKINDSLGHMFGDLVLQKASESITAIFRCSDVAGRIGGDEFMIFFRDVGNRNNVSRRAQQVCDIFRNVGREIQPPIETSCSVGVALCPDDGDSFEQLYRRADQALYSIKKSGKGAYALFDHETMNEAEPEKN